MLKRASFCFFSVSLFQFVCVCSALIYPDSNNWWFVVHYILCAFFYFVFLYFSLTSKLFIISYPSCAFGQTINCILPMACVPVNARMLFYYLKISCHSRKENKVHKTSRFTIARLSYAPRAMVISWLFRSERYYCTLPLCAFERSNGIDVKALIWGANLIWEINCF